MKYVIIKQTKVSGSGRNTKYSKVPNYEDLKTLKEKGFDAKLINIAPRGGIWGNAIEVPARQAKNALAGKFVTKEFEKEYIARKKKEQAMRDAAQSDYEANVVNCTEFFTDADVGSLAIRGGDFKSLSKYCWVKDDLNMIPNGYGDGEMRNKFVLVKEIDGHFSRHAQFGNQAPQLMAEVVGKFEILFYDCDNGVSIDVDAIEPVRIYTQNRRAYVVGTKFLID